MRVLIIGGGRTGSHLARLLLDQGYDVRVVEGRAEVLDRLHRDLPTEVILEGEGTDPHILEVAGIEHADVLAAVLPDDADNLMVASMGRHHYGVRRIIGRINDPGHAALFSPDFGIDVALNQADVMARLIEEEMSLGDMMVMAKLRRGKFSLVEEKIDPGAPAVGIALRDLELPANCTISGILRRGEMVLPRGTTVLEAGDEVIALVDDSARPALAKLLGRRDEPVGERA